MKAKRPDGKMKKKVSVLLIAGMLGVSLLGGCSEDWDEEPTEAVGAGVESTELESTQNENTQDENTDNGNNGYTDNEGLNFGSDLDVGTAEGNLDENSSQAIRRSVTAVNQVLITKLDGSRVSEDFYMYRNTLDAKGQRAYDQICSGCAVGQDTIEMSVLITQDELEDIFYSVVYDHPEFFWIKPSYRYYYNNDGYITKVCPSYYTQDIDSLTAEVEQSVNGALANMWALSSDVEKVKYAHDYLTQTIDYVRNDLDQSAYSGFVWKQTVCTGYSKCFAYMMHKMGIPSAVVVGSTDGINHAWNILELDGEYYLMDVTWDDPVGNPADTYYYNYFNITDAQMAGDHSKGTSANSNGGYIDISLALQTANGTRYSYQNAFGGNAYGTDFDAVNATAPETVAASEPETYTESDADYEWWSLLDDSWTYDDWEYDEGYYFIWDDETEFIYVYDPDWDLFGAMEEDGDVIYWYDKESGEWIIE